MSRKKARPDLVHAATLSDMDRRRFLQLSALTGISALGATVLDAAPAAASNPGKPGRGRSVTVLGGGLAGLCAAYELRRQGYKITAILEGQRRTGGRVLTVRKGFANGQYAEMGATRIADSHYFTLGYVNEFGLPLTQFPSGNGLYYLKGQAPFVHEDGTSWPSDLLPGLTGEDATLGADSISWKYDRGNDISDPSSASYLGDPRTAAWPYDNTNATALIPASYRDYWRDGGASDDAFLINRAINGSEIYSDGALYWLSADIVDATWTNTYAITGGNDRLPGVFTDRLSDVVRYRCKVTGLSQNATSATVTFENNGARSKLSSDFVVSALPFTTLRDVNISTPFPQDKMTTIRTLRYMQVSRYYMQTATRFWQQKGIGGLKVARTDSGIDRLWDNTLIQDGPTGIIQAYMQNQTGIDYENSGATFAQRSAYARGIVSQFFPEIEAQYLGGIEKIWQRDPWVKGAWGWYAPGEEGMFPVSKRPEGRIHFCGEHTSAWSGWMQGAFESANRVVNEITNG